MSIMPSNAIASAVQAATAQTRAGAAKQAEAVSTDTRVGAFSDQLSLTIQESDADSSVFADAEGQGGYGNGHEKHAPAEEQPSDQPTREPTTGGIDLTA